VHLAGTPAALISARRHRRLFLEAALGRSCFAGAAYRRHARRCRRASPKPVAQDRYSGEACALITDGAEKSNKNQETLAPVLFERKWTGAGFRSSGGWFFGETQIKMI